MAELVDLGARRAVSQGSAWEAYCAAVRRAQETLAIEDGLAAGHAFRRWLELFLTEEQRGRLGAAGPMSDRSR